MNLIKPDDPQYFEQSCYKDYDRHHYKVVSKNGDSIVVEDYMSAKKYGGTEGIPFTYQKFLTSTNTHVDTFTGFRLTPPHEKYILEDDPPFLLLIYNMTKDELQSWKGIQGDESSQQETNLSS